MTGRSGARPTPPATIDEVATDRGVEAPAGAERPAHAEHVARLGAVQRPAHRADVADRVDQRAVVGRRVAADRDRDLADAAGVEHA